MSDLNHLEYLFTRDSFTGLARPDPRALLGHVQGASWADQHGHASAAAAAAAAANPHPGVAGSKCGDASSGAAEASAFEKYSSAAANLHQRHPAAESAFAPYVQQGASRAAMSGLGKGGGAGAAGRAYGGGASADGPRWPLPGAAMPHLNANLSMAAAAFAMAQRNLLHSDSSASGKDGGHLAASPLGKPQTGNKPAAASATAAKPAAAAGTERTDTITCQVCAQVVPSNSIRKYIRVRKVCNACRTSDCVMKNGKKMRFCQLCSWFHPVDNFEGTRHSCKSALVKHNERRRQKTVKSKGGDEGAEVKSEPSQ